MTKEEFVAAHPDFVWWCSVLLLAALLIFSGWVWRYTHPPVSHEERHHHYGGLMLLFMFGGLGAFVLWVCWLVWHKDMWAFLHHLLM